MLSTSSVTRNCYVSTRISSITPRTFFKCMGSVVQSTWNTSSGITMEAILLLIHLASFLVALILTTLLLKTERGFLHKLYINADYWINGLYLEVIRFLLWINTWSLHISRGKIDSSKRCVWIIVEECVL